MYQSKIYVLYYKEIVHSFGLNGTKKIRQVDNVFRLNFAY